MDRREPESGCQLAKYVCPLVVINLTTLFNCVYNLTLTLNENTNACANTRKSNKLSWELTLHCLLLSCRWRLACADLCHEYKVLLTKQEPVL